MKILRIILTQSKAHYRKEESVTNKMTYPLPPLSTVIGALHNACNYKEYHPMDLSIQGQYQSLIKQPYTDHCFLDSTQDDRGTLVKLKNKDIYSGYTKVASAIKSQGSSFKNEVTIKTYDHEILKEYQYLKFNLNKNKDLMSQLKKDKASKDEIAILKEETDKLKDQYDYFNSLTTSIKYYEVLHEVDLIIHIKADDAVLNDIKDNIYNMKSIGRSEDFVNVTDCDIIETFDDIESDMISEYSSYINYQDIIDEKIWLNEKGSGIKARGTIYEINKTYDNSSGKRIFDKKKVVYSSNYIIEELSDNVHTDGKYIINFN